MDCTVYDTLDIISKKWALMIIIALQDKEKRFSEIKRNLSGITAKTLSTRLKELEHEKIITKKTDDSAIPIRCTYSLNESGKELIELASGIKRWGVRWKFKTSGCRTRSCEECMS